MAGSGPAPKPDGQRRRRNAPTHGPEKVVAPPAPGVLYGPEPDDTWSDDVLLWWATWRAAPQAALFEETDWLRLRMLAPLAEKAFRGSIAAMTEVRMSESLLGATVTDRLKARIRVEREATEDRPLAPVHDARARIAERLKTKD